MSFKLHSSMNSDRSSDASSAYVDTECPAAGFVDTILNQYGPLFERRRAEWAQRRVPPISNRAYGEDRS